MEFKDLNAVHDMLLEKYQGRDAEIINDAFEAVRYTPEVEVKLTDGKTTLSVYSQGYATVSIKNITPDTILPGELKYEDVMPHMKETPVV